MSNSYFLKITNKCLKACNYDPLEDKFLEKPTQIVVRPEIPDARTAEPSKPQNKIEEGEFLSCLVKTFTDVLSDKQNTKTVSDFAYLTIHPREEKYVRDIITSCSNSLYVDKLPFVNATYVVNGLRNQHKTVKFIDQNPFTVPIWAQSVKLFKTLDVESDSSFSRQNNELIEIDDSKNTVIPIDHLNQASFEHDGSFWNDIKETLDHDQKMNFEKEIENLSKKMNYIQMSDCSTFQKDYHDNKAKTWNQNNYAVLSMKKKKEEMSRQTNACLWVKLTNAVTDSMYSQSENATSFPDAVKNLVTQYLLVTGKKSIDINKNFNLIFSVYRKRICQEIQTINNNHVKAGSKPDCSLCHRNFKSPFFPYILFYCMIGSKKNIFSRFKA